MQEINLDSNKYRFLELLDEVNRDGADMSALVYKLQQSDFFEAPASTIYHLNVKGGLCQHSLNVFDVLVELVNKYCPEKYDRETLIIVALLHDLDKMDKYEISYKNIKNYSPHGKKVDEDGEKFDWRKEKGYKTKENTNRFVYGHHGQNSEYIVNSYIPLKTEESAAITNHMGSTQEYMPYDMTAIFNHYTLASLLHAADFIATYVVEVL